MMPTAHLPGHWHRAIVATAVLVLVGACTSHDIPVAAPSAPAVTQPKPLAKVTPALPPRPINDDPSRLIGLDAAALVKLLGNPVRVRRDGTAEIQQFRVGDLCQIDAFLYRDTGVSRVTHYEIRHDLDRLDATAARQCLRTVIENGRTTS